MSQRTCASRKWYRESKMLAGTEALQFAHVFAPSVVNMADENGETVLHLAVHAGCEPLVRTILATPEVQVNFSVRS